MEKETPLRKLKQRERNTMLLLLAAYHGDLCRLKEMARGLADSEGRDEPSVLSAAAQGDTGNTVLHVAAMEGRVDVCRYLVEDLCLDVNQLNHRNDTPLYLSAFFGRVDATRYLLDHGADPTLCGKSGSPLHGAAGNGQCATAELLLSRGINADLDSALGTPLHMAATHGQDGVMKILLEHHADPNKVFKLDTPLAMAIRPIPAASMECVKLLIKAGADVNYIDSNGMTYVMMAVNYGLAGILKCLLDAGGNPNIPDEFGRTPIEFAALQGSEFVEILFPSSSPISTFPDWSIDGIVSHVKSCGLKPRDEHQCEKRRAELKSKAAEAYKRKEYLIAGELYNSAMKLGPMAKDDFAILLANRSICWLRLENGVFALRDATQCRMLRCNWPKACYRQGAALMFLKDYAKAHEAFADGLKLDPKNVEMEKALREAKVMMDACCAEN